MSSQYIVELKNVWKEYKIDETVVFFEEREQEVKNILESQINFVDPSI